MTAMTEVTAGYNHGFFIAGSRLKLFLYTVEAFSVNVCNFFSRSQVWLKLFFLTDEAFLYTIEAFPNHSGSFFENDKNFFRSFCVCYNHVIFLLQSATTEATSS